MPKDAEGFSQMKMSDKMDIGASHTADLSFDVVRVPLENRLDDPDYRSGGKGAQGTLAVTRPCVGAFAVGQARAAFEYSADYARERKTIKCPPIEHQGVGFVLADMGIAIKAARLLTWRAGKIVSSNQPFDLEEASKAKTFASDMAVKITTGACPWSSQGQAATPSGTPRYRYSNAAACPALDAGSWGRPRSPPTEPTTRATSSWGLHALWVMPLVAQNEGGRRSAIYGRTTRHEGYRQSQLRRTRVEEVFGWIRTVGTGSKLRHLGQARNKLWFELTAAAYNPTRLANIKAASGVASSARDPAPSLTGHARDLCSASVHSSAMASLQPAIHSTATYQGSSIRAHVTLSLKSQSFAVR